MEIWAGPGNEATSLVLWFVKVIVLLGRIMVSWEGGEGGGGGASPE